MQQREYPKGQEHWRSLPAQRWHDRLDIGGFQVMQRWEEPLMQAMAKRVMIDRDRDGHILEIGFGMAISADMIMTQGPASYTVIEAHPEIAEDARQWGARQPAPVVVHEGFFQDIAPTLTERYDGILFDPYPITADEWRTYHLDFMPIAKRLLHPGGCFVYFTGQTKRFSEEHAEAMLELFDDVRLFRVDGLQPPPDCDYWEDDHMVLASGHLAGAATP